VRGLQDDGSQRAARAAQPANGATTTAYHPAWGLRLPRPASRRAHFVSHAYIVPHATDKTRWVGLDRRPDPGAHPACGPRRSPGSPTPHAALTSPRSPPSTPRPQGRSPPWAQCPRVHWTGWPSWEDCESW